MEMVNDSRHGWRQGCGNLLLLLFGYLLLPRFCCLEMYKNRESSTEDYLFSLSRTRFFCDFYILVMFYLRLAFGRFFKQFVYFYIFSVQL